MGLLDDAIREHLDLKRRRGADPTEVEREEREVLGPAHQRADTAHADELEPEPVHDQEFERQSPAGDVSWHTGDTRGAGEPPPPVAAFDHEEFAEHEPVEPEPQREAWREPEARRELEVRPEPQVWREPEVRPEPETRPEAGFEPEPAPRPERPPYTHAEPPDAGGATVEYSVEDAADEEGRHPHHEGEEDVLEETPEFLQDTPDHDRLWFEQRPPRDFDFDG